jgi:putative (di)nucleoside polyphosphate hydrolase
MTDLADYRPTWAWCCSTPTAASGWAGAPRPRPAQLAVPAGRGGSGEDVEAAARRELAEETGATSVSPLGRTDGWIAYDYPPELLGAKRGRGFKGQKQVWFALRFDGEEAEFDLAAHHEPEFDAWRWGYLAEAPELVVPFKRAAYEQVVAAFALFAATKSATA